MHSVNSADYGVGARLSVAVMADNYAEVILGALAEADATGLTVTTDDVSTYLAGDEQPVVAYLTEVIAGCARTGHHVSAQVLLSRGCPGAVHCELSPDALAQGAEPPVLEPSGVRAAAHWSHYPLGVPADHDYMADIEAAIAHARERGVTVRAEHYATRLDGDLADVLGTIASAWLLTGRHVQHVVTHATLSLNSPTAVAR